MKDDDGLRAVLAIIVFYTVFAFWSWIVWSTLWSL